MPAEYQIRLAREEELEAAGEIVSLAFASFRDALPPHIFEPYLENSSNFAGLPDEADVAVLESGGQLAGTVTYYEDAAREDMGWTATGLAGMRTLAVIPSVQGRGYGRALCDWCIRRARKQGAEALVLHTAAFMESARKLYESLGFERRPAHDLKASVILDFDPVQGDQRIVAYRLPL